MQTMIGQKHVAIRQMTFSEFFTCDNSSVHKKARGHYLHLQLTEEICFNSHLVYLHVVPGPRCSLIQIAYCLSKAVQLFIASGAYRMCQCLPQCHQPTYPHSVSTSPLSEHFINYMSQKSQFKGRNLTMSKLSNELTYLDIFYSDLSYVDIQTTPAYDLLTLVCDIGGALGLILGGTLLTVVEFVQLFVQLFNELIVSTKLAKMQSR